MLPSCLLHLNTFCREYIGDNKVFSNFHSVSHVDSFLRGLSPTPRNGWVAQPPLKNTLWGTVVSPGPCWLGARCGDSNIFALVLGALRSWDPSLRRIEGAKGWFSHRLGERKPLLVELTGGPLVELLEEADEVWRIPSQESMEEFLSSLPPRHIPEKRWVLLLPVRLWHSDVLTDLSTECFTAVLVCLKLHN